MLLALLFISAAAAAQQAPPAPSTRFVVILDAAHGGDDQGAQLTVAGAQPQPEKAYTLALSVRLRSLLGARGIQVVTTRESDGDVAYDRRAEIANHAKAAACLSLHASETGTGIHLYTSSLAPVAAGQMIPWKTAQAAWVTRSLALAGILNSTFAQAGMTVTLGRTALPAIDSMACPAVAVEIAPVHGQTLAGDTAYQTRVAQALAAALLEWRTGGLRSTNSSTEAVQP